MGTRSVTTVFDEQERPLVRIYGQWDGYPDGLGADLAGLLEGRVIVNGISGGATLATAFNGCGCMAAAIVAGLKNKIGDFYLIADGEDWGADYLYEVHGVVGEEPHITCKGAWDGEVIFSGHATAAHEAFVKEAAL